MVLGIGCAEAQQAEPTAQSQPPAPTPGSTSSSSSSSSAPAGPKEPRFSGGLTLTVLGLGLIPGRTSTINTSTELSTEYQTTNASERIGYGLTVQARIRNHFYLDLSGLLRHIGYQETTTVSTTTIAVLNGSTYPSTTTTSTHEDTRARLIDVPLLVRYYGTGKRPGSPRWFLEIGGTGRLLNGIRTSMDSTDSSGTVTCCTFNAVVPKNRESIGMTVGAGIQFTDEFGIHVVPEFRYTRWTHPVFENLTTVTDTNEIEADISLTF